MGLLCHGFLCFLSSCCTRVLSTMYKGSSLLGQEGFSSYCVTVFPHGSACVLIYPFHVVSLCLGCITSHNPEWAHCSGSRCCWQTVLTVWVPGGNPGSRLGRWMIHHIQKSRLHKYSAAVWTAKHLLLFRKPFIHKSEFFFSWKKTGIFLVIYRVQSRESCIGKVILK